MRTGAPFEKARMAPGVPTPTPISALPEITACRVSPAPCVPKLSRTMPCFWKIPAFMPSVGTWLDQASIWPTATLSASCAPAGAVRPHTTERTAKRTNMEPRRDFDLWPCMVLLLPPATLSLRTLAGNTPKKGLHNLFPPHPAAIHLELEPAHRRAAEMPAEARARGTAPHDLVGEKRMQIVHRVDLRRRGRGPGGAPAHALCGAE